MTTITDNPEKSPNADISDHEAKARDLHNRLSDSWFDVNPGEAVIAIAKTLEASAEDLSRKLEEARGRIGELESELKQERLWKLTPDEHRDYLEARYKSVSHDLDLAAAREAAKDARIAELEADVTFHKEIADAREFDFHEAEKRAAEPTDEDGFTKSDQAYQVIGVLATIANCFEHAEVTRALDYFSSDRFDPEFLPFSASAICAALESATLEGKSDA